MDWKKCPKCGDSIAKWFKVCQKCFDNQRIKTLDKKLDENKEKEFMQDKIALGTANN